MKSYELQRKLTLGIENTDHQSIMTSWTMPSQAAGIGLNEAPRGALGHWININNQVIANYQMVVPPTWNFGPRIVS